jgi:hypothetical protein
MILSAFTLFHVALSLAGIGAGLVVAYGLLTSKRLDGWTNLFLVTTALTITRRSRKECCNELSIQWRASPWG